MPGPTSSRLRRVIDAVANRLPPRRDGAGGDGRPALSVIMPVYNVEEYLPAAIDSVLNQTFTDLELIAVNDGSTDSSLEILRQCALTDGRLRIIDQPNAGQGAARNRGVAQARGEFLTFVDSDDIVPPRAHAHMIDSLRTSGSDFNVGSVVRIEDGDLSNTTWVRTVHWTDHIAVTLDRFPEAMHDIICCNRMFRTQFWREEVGEFESGHAYEDHVPLLRAYVRARSFDILAEVTYRWRVRRTSTGQQKARTENLQDRILVKRQAEQMLRSEGVSPYVYDLWVARVLEVDLPPFVHMARTATAEYRDLLSTMMRSFLDKATPQALARVRVVNKVRSQLVAAGRWDDLEEAEDHFRRTGSLPPARIVQGHVEAQLPMASFLQGLMESTTLLAPSECQFQGVIGHLEPTAEGLTLKGWALLRGVSLAPGAAHRAWLVDGSHRIELATDTVPAPEATWSRSPRFADYSTGFRALLPFSLLPPRETSWAVEVELRQEGLTARGTLDFREPQSGVGVAKSWPVELSGATAGLTAGWTKERGFRIDVDLEPITEPGPPELAVTSISHSGADRVLSLTVTHPGSSGLDLDACILGNATNQLTLRGVTTVGATSHLDWSLETPSGSVVEPMRLRLQPGGPDSRAVPLSRDLSLRAPFRSFDPVLNLRVGQNRRGAMVLDLTPPLREDELGGYHQQRLREQYWELPHTASDRTAFFQCGEGGPATGQPMALDLELARREPSWRRLWGVRDLGVEPPEGALPVLVGSREWHQAISTATFIVSDSEIDPHFRTRAGQPCVRTFPEDALDHLGRTHWESLGRPEHEIRDALKALADQCDLMLAADRTAAARYRHEFAFEGEIIVLDDLPTNQAMSHVLAQLVGRTRSEDGTSLRPDPSP